MTNPRPGGLLFVYGTLRRDVGAPAYALFVKHAALYDDGTITGRLFDLGSYPGGILSDRPEERIYGEVYVLRTPRPTLALLDRYEGVAGTRGNAPALYDRVQVSVATQRTPRSPNASTYAATTAQ